MKVTIVVPYFNAKTTIKCCVEAIKQQMEPEDELIIVNDGSSEDHARFLHQFDQCKVLSHSKNQGAARARNLGMKEASHENLVFVDADVFLQEGCLTALKNTLDEGADACFVVPSKKKQDNFFSDFKNLYMVNILTRHDQDLNYIYGSCCALGSRMRKHYWPTDFRLIEDNIWGFELWNSGAAIKKVRAGSFVHMKRYSAVSLIKNDFLVSLQFARFMIHRKRWSTVYTSAKFGHTTKGQKASVIAAFFIILMMSFSLTVSSLLFLCWLVLNLRVFNYFHQQRGAAFVLLAILWTYISHLVYFLGIMSGFFRALASTTSAIGNRVEQQD